MFEDEYMDSIWQASIQWVVAIVSDCVNSYAFLFFYLYL